ncbi:MAG TPA: amidohydrolase family protein [Acidobacteriaceae bacterium]
MLHRAFLLLSICLLTFPALGPAQAKPAGRTLVRAAHLVDVRAGRLLDAQTLVVSGDRIVSVQPTAQLQAQPGDNVIDLGNATLLPGMIDVHTHLTDQTNFEPYHELSTSVAKSALIGAHNAKITLEAGITTVRNVGADGFADVDLRDSINEGLIEGPHMQVSGPALGITGGHMDNNLLPEQYHVTADGVADGIPAVQHMVRMNIKYGADLIKIGATGGVLSKGDDPQASQYTLEEMQAIVADAHRLGRKVAAHAHGAQGILWASEAGVDSIEHGTYMNDEDIRMMKEKGTYFVPTAYLIDWVRDNAHLPTFYLKKMQDVSAVEKANAKHAITAGVKVAMGTDAAVYPHGLNAHEFEVYVRDFGMTPLEALRAGTVNAADLMGWSDRVGSLDPGKWADAVAVQGNPLEDITVLQHPVFVMKSGMIYRNDLKTR